MFDILCISTSHLYSELLFPFFLWVLLFCFDW